MNIKEIQEKVEQPGVNSDGMSKVDLIRSIQRIEGFEPCYASKMFRCNNIDCLWRKDCQGLVHLFGVENAD